MDKKALLNRIKNEEDLLVKIVNSKECIITLRENESDIKYEIKKISEKKIQINSFTDLADMIFSGVEKISSGKENEISLINNKGKIYSVIITDDTLEIQDEYSMLYKYSIKEVTRTEDKKDKVSESPEEVIDKYSKGVEEIHKDKTDSTVQQLDCPVGYIFKNISLEYIAKEIFSGNKNLNFQDYNLHVSSTEEKVVSMRELKDIYLGLKAQSIYKECIVQDGFIAKTVLAVQSGNSTFSIYTVTSIDEDKTKCKIITTLINVNKKQKVYGLIDKDNFNNLGIMGMKTDIEFANGEPLHIGDMISIWVDVIGSNEKKLMNGVVILIGDSIKILLDNIDNSITELYYRRIGALQKSYKKAIEDNEYSNKNIDKAIKISTMCGLA